MCALTNTGHSILITEVSLWQRKLQVHQSCQLLCGADLTGVNESEQITLLHLANNCADCSVTFIRHS